MQERNVGQLGRVRTANAKWSSFWCLHCCLQIITSTSIPHAKLQTHGHTPQQPRDAARVLSATALSHAISAKKRGPCTVLRGRELQASCNSQHRNSWCIGSRSLPYVCVCVPIPQDSMSTEHRVVLLRLEQTFYPKQPSADRSETTIEACTISTTIPCGLLLHLHKIY